MNVALQTPELRRVAAGQFIADLMAGRLKRLHPGLCARTKLVFDYVMSDQRWLTRQEIAAFVQGRCFQPTLPAKENSDWGYTWPSGGIRLEQEYYSFQEPQLDKYLYKWWRHVSVHFFHVRKAESETLWDFDAVRVHTSRRLGALWFKYRRGRWTEDKARNRRMKRARKIANTNANRPGSR